MDIYERLTEDHNKQRGLLGGVGETSGDSKERQRLFAALKKELEAHANAEEQVFYSVLLAEPEGQDKARHSVSEHKEMNDLIAELEEADMSTGGWLTKFKDLRHKVEHHVDEEEEEVFARARKLLSDKEANDMVAEFDKRKEAEEKQV